MEKLSWRYIVVALYFAVTKAQSECPQGWTKWLDEKCYSLETSFLPYEAAQQVCATKGGLIASIKEEDQQNFLDNFVHNEKAIQDEIWIGATRVSPTEFKWEDGTPLDYSNWGADSPSVIEGRACVVMQAINSEKLSVEGTWRDVSCTRPNYFVCESKTVWNPDEIRKVLLETRKKLDNLSNRHEQLADKHKTEIEDLVQKQEALILNPVPIGFVYTQLPGQPFPSALWPSVKWIEISSQFAGLFLRVAGGAAAEFGTIQAADSPRFISVVRSTAVTGEGNPITITPGEWSNWILTGGDDGTVHHHRYLVSNAEVRPVNTAIRVWVRESQSQNM